MERLSNNLGKLLNNLFGDLFNNIFGAIFTGGGGGIGGILGSVFGGLFHSGGVVPGMSGQEVPILAEPGEIIFTPDQLRALGNSGFGGITVVNNIQGNADQFTIDAIGRNVRTVAAMVNQGNFVNRLAT